MNIDELRMFCFSLKGTQEDIKWGNDLCFTIGGKMYCVTGIDGEFGISLKCTEEDFQVLIEQQGIIPAPYLARNNWILIQKPEAFTKEEWEKYIHQSYKLVFEKLPKKLKIELRS